MSKKIDERVVEMQFDNKKFESNIKTSMSTLDKLRKKLEFDGASKGLDSISRASKSFNLNGVTNAIETVRLRFNALQIMGVAALSNIANEAIATGKRMISSLTISPIKTGFAEYETKIGSIQTILANTSHQGTNLQDVNKALSELNTYADKTIYNFAEMTKNIGTFTAAGLNLDVSTKSIQGIANLAAISGSTSQQASTAMYQLSQALSSGTVRLMDWNSVVNAGMGGKVFQNAIIETAKSMDLVDKSFIKAYESGSSFRELLNPQDYGDWFSSELLSETLMKFTKSGAVDYLAKTTGVSAEAILKLQKLGDTVGYNSLEFKEMAVSISNSNEEISKNISDTLSMANTAEEAATKVKTFTQLTDTLKEAAQSGWSQSWEIMIGDFEEAKNLLTKISDVVGGMINTTSENRNKVLREGLSTGWKQLLNEGISDEELFKENIQTVAKEHGIAIEEMIKNSGSLEKSFKDGWVTGDILSQSIEKMTNQIESMSEEQLKSHGFTTEQIDKLKQLNQSVKDGTADMDLFAKKISMKSGRENIITGMTNLLKELGSAIAPVRESFKELFPSITGEQLYNITDNFKTLTEKFKISEESSDKIKRTFTGMFSIVSLFGKAINAVLTPIINFATGGGVSNVVGFILNISAAIGDFLTSLNESENIIEFFEIFKTYFSDAFQSISKVFGFANTNFTSFEDTISALGNSIKSAFGLVGDVVKGVLTKVGDGIKWLSDNLLIGHVASIIAGGGIFMVAKKFGKVLDFIKDTIDKFFNKENNNKLDAHLSELLGNVKDSLSAFTSGVKSTTLLTIAASVGLLAISLRQLSEIDPGSLSVSLVAMASMLAMLSVSFSSITSSLKTFGGKGTVRAGISLMALATALKIMSSAVDDISKIDIFGIVKGLSAMAIALKLFKDSIKVMGSSNVSIKTTVSLIGIAGVCKMLGDILEEIGQLSWVEISKGLVGMGVALAEFQLVIKQVSKIDSKNSIKNAFSIYVISLSLNDIGAVLKEIGNLSWTQITKGLTQMGIALAEFSLVLKSMNNLKGMNSIKNSVAILILVQSVKDIVAALGPIGQSSMGEIVKGLSGIGLALTELVLVLKAMDKFNVGSSITNAISIVIVAKSLNDITKALIPLGQLSLEKAGTAIIAIGAVLGELVATLGLMKLFSKGSNYLSEAITVNIAALALKTIADALMPLGQLSLEQIQNGLIGLGLALTELGVVLGALAFLGTASGGLGAVAELVAAGSLWLAIQGLDELAEALQKFGSMSWDEIGRGLTAMGSATLVTAIGGFVNTLSGLGGIQLGITVRSLDELAQALQAFGSMSWDEIGRGLTAMAGALGEVALGSFINTLSGLGALSIAVIAEPLGQLAESVKKWIGITVPEGLGTDLALLADGVLAFTFAGLGAGAIADVAEPLGKLCDSVQKWIGVIVPEGLSEQLINLSSGVGAFTFSGLGAGAIAEVAQPLGVLADSVKKWIDITVPDGIKENLSNLATGVSSFTFAGFGASALSEAATPLGTLADSVKKWIEIQVPEGIGDSLSNLATGVSSFTFAGFGAKGIQEVVEPLGSLADAVSKWSNVIIPEGLEENLISLANGVKGFNLGWFENYDIAKVVGPLASLAGSITSWNGVVIPADLGENLTGLANGLKSFVGLEAESLASATSAINSMCVSIQNLSLLNLAELAANVSLFFSSISTVQFSTESFVNIGNQMVTGITQALYAGQVQIITASKLLATTAVATFSSAVSSNASNSAGQSLINSLSAGIQTGIVSLKVSTNLVLTSILTAINGKSQLFMSAGKTLITSFATGILSSTTLVTLATLVIINSSIAAIDASNGSFFNAGLAAAQGFANGISSGAYAAEMAAYAMGIAAANAAKEAIQSHSPSKVFKDIGSYIPQGFALGIETMGDRVESSTYSMTNTAINSATKAMSRMSDIILTGVDTQPVIRPVVDLDEVYQGAKAINNSLSLNPSVGLMSNIGSISVGMDQRNQNRSNDDVIRAINQLDKSIRENPNNVTTINGITYDDGSNVANAISEIVRAAKVERRS